MSEPRHGPLRQETVLRRQVGDRILPDGADQKPHLRGRRLQVPAEAVATALVEGDQESAPSPTPPAAREKVLFDTDYPFLDPKTCIGQLGDLGFKDETLEGFFWGNGACVSGL